MLLSGALHLKWHPTQEMLLGVCGDGSLKLWDARFVFARCCVSAQNARSMELVREWHGPSSTVNDLAVASDWSFFATGEDEGPALLFSMSKK